MAAGDLALNILIGASAGGALSVISNVGRSISMLGSGNIMGAVEMAAATATTAVIGLGVASAKMAGDFQQGMTQLVTGAGESQAAIGMVSDGILKMAVSTGTSTKQLTSGMYMIESAGYHGAAGLNVLQVAAEGAKVGNADLGTVANALTTILTDYHMSGSQAADAMNALTTTVASGKTHLQDLAGAMGSVLPLASSLGVSFPQVGGALATMTNAGMSAQRAAMNLANTMRSLAAPNATAQKSMRAVGISAQQLHDALTHGGLTAAIQMVEQHVGQKFPAGSVQAVQAFKAIMGGATGYNVALMLGGKNMAAFEQNVRGISGAMASGKGQVIGWAAVQQDFNFKMAQAKEVVETLMIKIGSALLPVISQLMGSVMPVITQFGNWITSGNRVQGAISTVGSVVQRVGSFITSNLLPPAMQLVQTFMGSVVPAVQHLTSVVVPLAMGFMDWMTKSGALRGVLGVVATVISSVWVAASNLINTLATVIRFFSQNQAAAVALLIPLGALIGYFSALAVGAIVSFIAAAPAMIAGFIAGAAAAWTMAAGVIAATWPFILIGVAIAAVIAIVILLVAHWSQVVSFLRGAWSAFSGWFMGALRAVGAFFVAVWNGIVAGLQAAIAFIINIVKTGFLIWLAYITFPIRMVAALFVWLYEHNRYFQMLIDAIVGIVKAGVAWLVSAWQATVKFLAGLWAWIASLAQSVWSAVAGFISAQVSRASGFLRSVWTSVVGFLSGIWASISSGVSSMWGKISSIFSSAWGTYVAGPIHSIGSSIGSFFSNLASQAIAWGANIIKGFISGITSMIGAVGNAAHSVVSAVANFLGFHSPAAQGEGRHIIEWGENLVKGFVSGMDNAMPLLNAQVSHMIQAPSSIAYGGHAGAGSGSNAFALTGGQTIVVQVQPAKADISLDKKKVGEGVMQYAAKEIRIQGNVKNK